MTDMKWDNLDRLINRAKKCKEKGKKKMCSFVMLFALRSLLGPWSRDGKVRSVLATVNLSLCFSQVETLPPYIFAI
jgi:hypothetical protein